MDDVARLPGNERAELYTETAARMNLTPVLIEKDFWVCWTLKRLFEHRERRLLFKGGTSLSKAFGLIRRFSEDIDIALDRFEFGFTGDRDPATDGLSGRRRQALLDDMRARCLEYAGGPMINHLRSRSAELLVEDSAFELARDEADDATVVFRYPQALEAGAYGGYVAGRIQIEFGIRSDPAQRTNGLVCAYAAERFPEQFRDPKVRVEVQTSERTFWEKATLLHEKNHRGFRGHADRQSRHYADLVAMSRSESIRAVLTEASGLEPTAQHKAIFFRVGGNPYASARRGTLRFVPAEGEDLAAVRADYGRMRDMFFDEPVPFEGLLAELRSLEEELNRPA